MAKAKKTSRPKAMGSGKPSSDAQRMIFIALLAAVVTAGAIVLYQYWADSNGSISESSLSITSPKKEGR
ncbi:MAG TPA: hypothetical protein VGE13_03595 [Candidatus Saccharimonadales bacterium]